MFSVDRTTNYYYYFLLPVMIRFLHSLIKLEARALARKTIKKGHPQMITAISTDWRTAIVWIQQHAMQLHALPQCCDDCLNDNGSCCRSRPARQWFLIRRHARTPTRRTQVPNTSTHPYTAPTHTYTQHTLTEVSSPLFLFPNTLDTTTFGISTVTVAALQLTATWEALRHHHHPKLLPSRFPSCCCSALLVP